MSDRHVATLPGKTAVLAENGPMRLVIQAFSGSVAEIELAKEAAQYAFDCLARAAGAQHLLKKRHGLIGSIPGNDIARAMLKSVRLIGDDDLTPMAAVAGTIADFVADWLFDRRVTRVIVNNGGDIAIRLKAGESAGVGLRPDIQSRDITHRIRIDARFPSWGVNTSGLGGRSLTRGIASAVTAFAATSSLADAAATAIANACFTEHRNIHQAPADSVDPNTDLGKMPVTVGISDLPEKTVRQVLDNGLKKATAIQELGHIRGALIAVGGQFAMTPDFSKIVGEVQRFEKR
jgi:ApbE superfamily uncharacterized protein (UPF0280 family)